MGHWGTLLSYKTPVWGGASFASTNPRLGQVRDALLQNPRKGVWSPSESTVQKYEEGGGGRPSLLQNRRMCVGGGGNSLLQKPVQKKGPVALFRERL